jgi:hypothetical protein
VNSNRSVLDKNILDLNAVVFCGCTSIRFFVAFCVVTVVRKFDLRLVMNQTPKIWRLVERRSCSDRDKFFDRIYLFFPDRYYEC